MTHHRPTANINYSYDLPRDQFIVRVTAEVWPEIQELLVQAGKIRNCDVTFTRVEDHDQS